MEEYKDENGNWTEAGQNLLRIRRKAFLTKVCCDNLLNLSPDEEIFNGLTGIEEVEMEIMFMIQNK